MSDFHVGDEVIISASARVERGAVFTITEFRTFRAVDKISAEVCATGDGHAWWPVDMLDFNLSPDQRDVRERLERAYYDAAVALTECAEAERDAARLLTGRMIKQIRDAKGA